MRAAIFNGPGLIERVVMAMDDRTTIKSLIRIGSL